MKNIYDNSFFFKEYKKTRAQQINANNVLENPIMKEMLPNVFDKTILDLGCGDGNMDKYFISKGAKKVVAVDLSKKMIAEAKRINKSSNIEYLNLDMEDLSSVNETFDIVYSSLAFHYVENFDKLIKQIYNLLKPNGVLIFSQENPLKTALVYSGKEQKNKVEINGKRYQLLSDYLNEGERNKIWNKTEVTKFHRSFATIISTLINNNFNLLEIKDSIPTSEALAISDKYKSEFDCPNFLFIKAKKYE